MRPPVPPDERERLAALRDLHVMDTPPEDDFDQIVALASRICGTSMSLVSLIDEDRQWYKAKIGTDEVESARDVSFCAYAILGRDLMVVPDARHDVRFSDNPAVTMDPGIRFYAGAPLVTSDGHGVGTLCVVDGEPRRLTLEQLQALRALARQVTAQMELRHYAEALAGANQRLREAEQWREDLIALAGGELRAPLGELRGYLDALAAGAEPDATTAAAAVRQHAAGLRHLLGMALDAAGDEHAPALRMREVDLTRIAQRAVAAVRPIAAAKQIWIVNYPGPTLPVMADPVRLEQALMHLLFSAVKYTSVGGRIRVCTEVEAGPAVHLDDLDVPDGERPRLFEHLYYGAIATPADLPGPDQTLAVTKQILDAHHATLALSDRPGDGTSLHLVFPHAVPDRIPEHV
jgi:signal transduction histidine kinase